MEFFANQKVHAQCPTLDPSIGTSDFGAGIEVCYQPGGAFADVTFTFLNDGSDFENFLLFDVANSSFLIQGFSPVVYVHTAGSNIWVVQNVPDEFISGINSVYVFAKAGCGTYGGAGIDIVPNDELRIEDADISITNNTRCIAPYNGAINITATGGYGTITYAWTGPNGFSSGSQNISSLEPGTYTIVLTDGHNCTYTRNIDVADDATDPIVSINGLNLTNEYCESNGIVTLDGSAAPNGTFSGPGVTDNGNGTANFDPAAAGIGGDIIYTYTDGLGCTGSFTETVTVYATPSDATNPVDNSYCAGAALTALSVDDPGAGFRVDWYDAITAGTLTGTGAIFTPASAGTYWAEVVSIAGS